MTTTTKSFRLFSTHVTLLLITYAATIILGTATAFVPYPIRDLLPADASFHRHTTVANDDISDCSSSFDDDDKTDDNRRKTLLSLGLIPAATLVGRSEPAEAARRQPFTFLVTTKNTTTAETFRKDPVDVETPSLSSELCLLRLLPVKNPVFKSLDGYIQSLSILRMESK